MLWIEGVETSRICELNWHDVTRPDSNLESAALETRAFSIRPTSNLQGMRGRENVNGTSIGRRHAYHWLQRSATGKLEHFRVAQIRGSLPQGCNIFVTGRCSALGYFVQCAALRL